MSTSREREQGREKPRLVLCDGWRGVQGHLLESLGVDGSRDPLAVREIVIVVPTAAAGHLLRNTLEQELLDRRVATFLPTITTMSALTRNLVERSLGRVRLVDPLLREALLEQTLSETAQSGTPPPFTSREALSPRILALYDELWSAGHRLEDFVSRAEEEFDVPEDVGAQRMAEQTRFLGEGLRRYREKLSALGLEDPTTVFSALLERGAPFPYRRSFIIGSGAATPRELSFLTSLVGLDSLEHLVPESMANAHPVRSLYDSARFESIDAPARTASPTLLRPEGENAIAFVGRDREEVLVGVARLLKARAATGSLPALERIAVVVPSPLPYLYLAKKALGQAGIPYQLQNDFPLATEPYLAASDLVLSYVKLSGIRFPIVHETFVNRRKPGAQGLGARDHEALECFRGYTFVSPGDRLGHLFEKGRSHRRDFFLQLVSEHGHRARRQAEQLGEGRSLGGEQLRVAGPTEVFEHPLRVKDVSIGASRPLALVESDQHDHLEGTEADRASVDDLDPIAASASREGMRLDGAVKLVLEGLERYGGISHLLGCIR